MPIHHMTNLTLKHISLPKWFDSRLLQLVVLAVLTVCGSTVGLFAKKKTVLEPSYSWGVEAPLGARQPEPIDTLFHNYSLEFIPQLVTPAYAATGNYCGPGRNMLFMNNEPMSDFYFRDALLPWIPTIDKARFFNTRIPMTLLSYNFGGGKEIGQDRFSTIFSANANSRTQIGAMIDYIYSKGSYANQQAKDLNWGFSGSYTGEHFEFQGYITHFNLLTKENGGITDPLYITDPAVVQGGNTSVNTKQIPTNLASAFNRVKGTDLFLNSRYKLGFWKEEQVNDTTVKRTLVPVTSFIWTLRYRENKHKFFDKDVTENLAFWDHTYLNPHLTEDFQTYSSVQNTLGVALLEGFNKYAKAGLSVFVTHEFRKYHMESTAGNPTGAQEEAMSPDPYPGMIMDQKENLLWVGANIAKRQGRLFNYDVTGEIGLLGPAAGEIKVNGTITTRIPLFGDTVPIRAYGHFTNQTAPWLMQRFKSNHFIWENSFNKTRSLRIGGEISIPWTNTTFSATIENIQNQIYFDENALPAQYGGSAQVFSATLRQNFHFRAFHWENYLTYQQSTEEAVIPLPKLVFNTNMYVQFKVATLFVQFGVNCDYFTKYKGVGYQPATMAFYNQRSVDIGNYPFMNAYLNFKLSKTRFYVMMSHVNQGMTGTNYFSMPGYPMNPRRLQMGLSIDFAN